MVSRVEPTFDACRCVDIQIAQGIDGKRYKSCVAKNIYIGIYCEFQV